MCQPGFEFNFLGIAHTQQQLHNSYKGGCQNDGPFLGTLNIRSRIILGTQKGTIILITTHNLVLYSP